jgi:hypothetical protein
MGGDGQDQFPVNQAIFHADKEDALEYPAK